MYQDWYKGAKKIVKKDSCMKFYDTAIPIYLDTDASCISLAARLLQVRDDMNCGCDEVPDNATPCPTAFAKKPIKCGVALQHGMRGPCDTTWDRKAFLLLLYEGSVYYH